MRSCGRVQTDWVLVERSGAPSRTSQLPLGALLCLVIKVVSDALGFEPAAQTDLHLDQRLHLARRHRVAEHARHILEQQVSLESGAAAYKRLSEGVGRITPGSILGVTQARLQRMGQTRQKARYCRELASAIVEGRLDLASMGSADPDDVREQLMHIPGIGRWTADIYLIMVLLRPDVWPLGDIALANTMHKVKRLKERPDNDRQLEIAEPWRPHRAVAARCLWHYYLAGHIK